MNKLFTKIAALSVGLAMAVGVGVAVASDSGKASLVNATDTKVNFSTGNNAVAIKVNWNNAGAPASNNGVRLGTSSNAGTATFTIPSGTTKFGFYAVGWNGKATTASVSASVGTIATSTASLTSNSAAAGTISANATVAITETEANAKKEFSISSVTSASTITLTTSGSNKRLIAWDAYYVSASKTLSSIALSGTYPTSFTVGDTFSHQGMTVTATYSDSTSADVTSSATFSGYNMNSAGNQTVTVSYTEGGTTKTATYSITVSASTTPTLTLDSYSFSGYTGQSFSVTATFSNLESDLAWGAVGTGSISGGNITWSSNDHRNGTSTYSATLSGEGGKTITADADGVDAAQYVITITQTTVDITKSSTSIAQGKSETLAVTHNAESIDGLTWTSNNANVSVDDNGKVTVAKAAAVDSTATITATSKVDTSVFDTCTVTVTEAPLEYEVVFGTAEGTTGITDFSNTSIVKPSEVTLDNITGNVYGSTTNAKVALRFGKSGTTGSFDASISGNYYIVSVTCNLKYYGSDSTATFAVTPSGGSAISKSLTGDWADYTYDVSVAQAKKVTLGTDVNGKRAFLSGFTIEYAAQKTLSNIALSGTYPTTFTKGDSFSHAGMIVTANYSDSTSVNVTSSATWSTPDMSTPGNKTVTVSYEDAYGSVSQTYSITVNYANPTGITLSLNSKALALLEEFDVSDVGVTINPSATADQSLFEWVVYDEDGLVEGDTYEFTNGVFYATEPADAVVLRCQSTKEGYASTVYADVTVEITGDPIVTLYNASNVDKTSGTDSALTDAGDITYHVAIENFSGNITYTWSSSDDSIISVDSDNGASCDFYVEGDEGTARLSCRVQDTASHDVTVYVDVTISAWSVTSVTWDAPTIDVFSGATLSSSDTSSWNVKYSTDSGKTNQTPASFDVKLGGSTISLPHTWVAADDGKALCVEYGGVSSSATTVAVTQSINEVEAELFDSDVSDLTFTTKYETGGATAKDGKEWTVTSDGTESNFDNTKGIHFGTSSAAVQYIRLSSSDFTSGTITKVVVNASTASGVSATVSVKVSGSAFGGAAQSLSSSSADYTFNGEAAADEIEVEITKPTSATKALYCLSVKVTYLTSNGKVDIANVAAHKAAQRVAVKFANAFNTAMGTTANCTENMESAWATCSSAYNTFKSEAAALGEAEEAYAKNLIKYATLKEEWQQDYAPEDCIEKMVRVYKVCVESHGQTAFMNDLRPLQSRANIGFGVAMDNSSTSTIVIISALTGLAAIGGYFFLRKRKVQ